MNIQDTLSAAEPTLRSFSWSSLLHHTPSTLSRTDTLALLHPSISAILLTRSDFKMLAKGFVVSGTLIYLLSKPQWGKRSNRSQQGPDKSLTKLLSLAGRKGVPAWHR